MRVDIGIDMGGTRIKVGLVSEGMMIASMTVPASAHETLEARLESLATEIDNLLRQHDAQPLGVGIAFPGIADPENLKILSKYVKYPDAQGFDLSRWSHRHWGVPAALENDARAALLGEWQFGAGRGCDDLVLITLGTGVGSAVLLNGKILRGRHFIAGNLGGHLSINLYGCECNCGNTGCVESEASTWALQSLLDRSPLRNVSILKDNKEVSFNAVFAAAKDGDALALEIKESCLKAWSLAIINLILSYDPQRVIIGGGIMNSGDQVIAYVRKMMTKNTWLTNNEVELVAAEQIEFAAIFGMHYMLAENRRKI